MSDTICWGLYDADPARRLAALDRVPRTAAGRYALRDRLAGDSDARVRARAAERLGLAGEPRLLDALLEAAAGDPRPLVREAAWRSLARVGEPGDAAIGAAARRASAGDTTWWVRRAAVSATARIGGAAAAADLLAAFDDPFWRVRHTAIDALLDLGKKDAAVRHQVLGHRPDGEIAAAAIEYLRRRWSGEDAARLEPAVPAPPADPLWDPDPAVVTARLEDPAARPSPAFLVELLADPHEPLRRLAIRRLARLGDRRALAAALCWLEEPRIPHVKDAVLELVGRSGDLAMELAAGVLADPPGARVAIWALEWVGATGSAELVEHVRPHLEAGDAAVRAAAIDCLRRLGRAAAEVETLATLAAASEEPVQIAAVRALAEGAPDAAATLLDAGPARFCAAARRALVRVAARAADAAWLEAASGDADAEVRAAAVGALDRLGALSPAARAAALGDADPWVRAAAADAASAAALVRGDPDPGVRLAAIARLGPGELALELAESESPRVRAAAARRLAASTPAELRALVALTFDRQPMVRAAAVDALERHEGVDAALEALLAAETDPLVRRAAFTFRLRALDEIAAGRLRQAWADPAEHPEVRRHLEAMAIAFADDLVAGIPRPQPRRRRPRRAPELEVASTRRPLGRSGIELAPLVLSGAGDLVTQGFDRALEAGVDTYFWEPRYQSLGRFLRRPGVARQVQVVAGSYHGSAAAIEADVDTARRRLRRDRIDLFLVFWVRSAERLSTEVIDCLLRLKESGAIGAAGFSTHHRDLAASAIATQPWDAIMVRHSAAHPGAEDALLAEAARRRVGVLTFTALCYGRLLQDSPACAAPTAADCYRYSLSQPGVSAVLSAPRRYRELRENLEVLASPALAASELAALREHGRWVRAQSKDWAALVRRTPRELPRRTAERLAGLLRFGDEIS